MKNKDKLEDVNDILGFCKTLSILYIEDDKDVRENTQDTLETIFDTICTVTNGDDGFKEYVKYHNTNRRFYDIVLTDLRLPTISGMELSREILQLNPDQLIIVNSAYNQVEVLTKLIDLGIYIFLPKPMTFKQLFKVLKKVSTHIYSIRKNIDNKNEIGLLQSRLEKMQNEQDRKNEFFHNLANDILTPANAMMKLSVLASEVVEEQKGIGYLEKIQSSGDYLLAIVKNMLESSASQNEDIIIEDIEFNLNNIFDNISIMVATKAQDKGLEVIFDIDNSVPAIIKGDPLRLSQVIMALMENAIRHTDRGEIILKVKMSPLPKGKKLLIFEVIDSGIGLRSDELTNIFKVSSDNNSYTKINNGLKFTKKLVELMGGSIRVESRYGEGSRFVFSVVTQQAQKRSYRLPSKSLMSKKVLIVDGNPKSSLVLSQMLQYFRYDTTVSFNRDEAMKLFMDDNDFDIISIDRNFMSMVEDEAFMSESKAKIVLIEDGILHQNREIKNDMQISAKLYKPFTQKMIFDMIIQLFAEFKNGEYVYTITKNDILKLGGSHILLAEYDTITQATIRDLLKHTNIKITIADNGKEALALSKKILDLDMILLDSYLPNQNDYEATEEIRNDSRYINTPIVAILPNDSQESTDYAVENGFSTYICKPIEEHKLYELLLDNISPKVKALMSSDKECTAVVQLKVENSEKKYYDLRDVDSSLTDDKDSIKRFRMIAKSSDLKIEALLNVSRKNKAIEVLKKVNISSKEIWAFTLEDLSFNLIKAIESNSEEVYLLLNQYREMLTKVLIEVDNFLDNNYIDIEL